MSAGALSEYRAPLEETVELPVRGLETRVCPRAAQVGLSGEALQQCHHVKQVLVGKQEVATCARSLGAEERTGVMQAAECTTVGGEDCADGVLVGEKPALGADDREVHYPRLANRASCVRLQRKGRSGR